METTGLIASRYARALLDYSGKQGVQERVYAEVQALMKALSDEQRAYGDDGILSSCISTLSEEMQRFLSLVVRGGRADMLPFILHSYVRQYRQAKGITTARLQVACPSPDLEQKLTAMLARAGYAQVDFKTQVDDSLIGGFILQVDDVRLDASVATQLVALREELEEKNKRII